MEEIYSDIRKNAKILGFVSSSERSNLIAIVKGLDGICRLTRNSTSDVNNLMYLLDLRGSETKLKSSASMSEIDSSVRAIKNSSKVMMSASDRISLVKKAISSGVKNAIGSDIRKAEFLKEVIHGRDTKFLTDVLNKYNFDTRKHDYRGRNGKVICSKDYCEYILKECFVRTHLKFMGSDDRNYAEAIKKQFDKAVDEIKSDLYRGKTNNDFVKDENGIFFKKAIFELEKCSIKCYDLCNKIDDFMWYVGGNAAKIKELQCKLNSLGISGQNGRLKEDGVYGRETLSAWNKFLNNLERGVVPTLAWVDTLKTKRTHISIGATKTGEKLGLNNTFNLGDHRYIRFDGPHNNRKGWFRGKHIPINYNHINLAEVKNEGKLYKTLRTRYNHYHLSDEAYNLLKDLKKTGKKIRIGGRILLVAGIALDALELGTTIDSDLKDADKKIGKKTVSAAVSIGGRWAGAELGAELGAMAGTLTGPLAPAAIPILSIAGGIAGSFAGDMIGRYVVDITYLGE